MTEHRGTLTVHGGTFAEAYETALARLREFLPEHMFMAERTFDSQGFLRRGLEIDSHARPMAGTVNNDGTINVWEVVVDWTWRQ